MKRNPLVMQVGAKYSNLSLSKWLGSKNQGGIRYSGRFPKIGKVAVVLTTTPDAIYGDELGSGLVKYVGEGQSGNQRLERGNRVLTWCYFKGEPVHAFKRLEKNQFEYLGRYRVGGVSARAEPDRTHRSRGVFIFRLEPAHG